MSGMWWGKLVGGLLGLIVGGWLGLLIGVLIGHQLDLGIARELGRGGGRDDEGASAHGGRIQLEFFTTTFSVMGHLAKADGRVSEDEIAAARRVMRGMRLTPEQTQAAIRLFEQGKRPDFPLASVLEDFVHVCRGRRDLLYTFVEIQLQAALADGQQIHPETARILGQVCTVLGLSRLELAQLEAIARAHAGRAAGARPQQVTADRLGEAYRVLGIDRGASDEAVKKAYRRLISQHHPDKLVSKGLPQSMLDLAREKAREINIAYDVIKEARGMH
jgi:DnaJ like chaperone protein